VKRSFFKPSITSLKSQYSLKILSVFSRPAALICAKHIYISASPSGDNIMPITTVPYLISPCDVSVKDNEDKESVGLCLCVLWLYNYEVTLHILQQDWPAALWKTDRERERQRKC